jgi:hypothetical protein
VFSGFGLLSNLLSLFFIASNKLDVLFLSAMKIAKISCKKIK